MTLHLNFTSATCSRSTSRPSAIPITNNVTHIQPHIFLIARSHPTTSKLTRSLEHIAAKMPSLPNVDDVLPPRIRSYLRSAHRHADAFAKQVKHGANLATTGTNEARNQVKRFIRKSPISKHLSDDYVQGCVDAIFATMFLSACAIAVRKSTRQFPTAEEIPASLIRRRGTLHGVVVAVRDGDNVRVRHTPLLHRVFPRLQRTVHRSSSLLSDTTINVRLAGVDAPECTHGLRPGQPHGKEARRWLQQFATGRLVRCRLHATDQYRRVIATVYAEHPNPILKRFGLGVRNVGLELVKAGYATVYTGGGAQYGGNHMLRRYVRAEEIARRARIGMWCKGEEGVMLPGEFKRLFKTAIGDPMRQSLLAKPVKQPKQPKQPKLLSKQLTKQVVPPTPAAQADRPLVKSSEDEGALAARVLRVALDTYQWLRRLR